MNDFPLAPFFIALSADGIPVTVSDYDRVISVLKTEHEWTLAQLQNVLKALLVHDFEQGEIFRRRFETYFDKTLPVSENITPEVLQKALDELRSFALLPPRPEQPPVSEIPPVKKENSAKTSPDSEPLLPGWQYAIINIHDLIRRKLSIGHAVAVLLLLGILIGFWLIWFRIQDTTVLPRVSWTTVMADGEPNSISVEKVGEPVPTALTERTWYDVGGTLLLGGVPIILILAVLALVAKEIREQKPEFDPREPHNFPLRQIGGPARPRLDNQTLDALSDLLGYFLSENPGRRLNIARSVAATVRSGGLPLIYFDSLRQVRTVYILEDTYAEPLAWNPISVELAGGLERRGIFVRYGKFYDSPGKFQMQEGGVEWLEDLEAARDSSLLLFFSDGQRLNQARDRFTLEALARWSTVAWLDLREPNFWDEGAQIIRNYGIPLYEASAAGVMRALRRFLSEQNSQSDDAARLGRFRGRPAYVNDRLEAHLESLLGDAVAWAQACAMIQPVTIGMAAALRENFAAHLPPERIERLFRLPGSTRNASGLRFSLPVLAALRKGFTARWEPADQEKILNFIIDQIQKVEPPEKNSLRHLAWEWALERVRLEIDPDNALQKISRLALSPLAAAIKDEFSIIMLPGEKFSGREYVPLRVRPATPRGLLHFQNFAERTVSLPGLQVKKIAAVEFYRFVRTIKLGWLAAKKLIPRNIEFVRQLFSRRPPAPGNSHIFAEPPILFFKHLHAGREATSEIVFRSRDQKLLIGRVETDRDWIKISRKLAGGRYRRHTTDIKISTGGLASGTHSGEITFIPDQGASLKIPVTVQIVRSWREALREWWRENKPSRQLRLLLLCLLIGLAALFISKNAFTPNWLNQIFNRKPQLESLRAEPFGDQNSIRLTAVGIDPDGDSSQLIYQWKTDAGQITGNGSEVRLEIVKLEDLPRSISVNLTLIDEDGGRSAFVTMIDLNKQASKNSSLVSETQSPDPVQTPVPVSTLDPTGTNTAVTPVTNPTVKASPPVVQKSPAVEPDYSFNLYIPNENNMAIPGQNTTVRIKGTGSSFNNGAAYTFRVENYLSCTDAVSKEISIPLQIDPTLDSLAVSGQAKDLAQFIVPDKGYSICKFSSILFIKNQFAAQNFTEVKVSVTSPSPLPAKSEIIPTVYLQKVDAGTASASFAWNDQIEIGIRGFTGNINGETNLTSEQLRTAVKNIKIDFSCQVTGTQEKFSSPATVIDQSDIVFNQPLTSFTPAALVSGDTKPGTKGGTCTAGLILTRTDGSQQKFNEVFTLIKESDTPMPSPLINMLTGTKIVKPGDVVNFTLPDSSGSLPGCWCVSGSEVLSKAGKPVIAVKTGSGVPVLAAYHAEDCPRGCRSILSAALRALPAETDAQIKVLKNNTSYTISGYAGDAVDLDVVRILVAVNGKRAIAPISSRETAGQNDNKAKSRIKRNRKCRPAIKNSAPP